MDDPQLHRDVRIRHVPYVGFDPGTGESWNIGRTINRGQLGRLGAAAIAWRSDSARAEDIYQAAY